MTKNRSSFTGRVGFVLAAAGSAVGLGNLWRFPYLAAKYGGGIFLFVYLILAVTFGFALMLTEIAIGRKTGLSCIGAYKKLDKRFGFLGWISALVPVIIVPYYCVIGGWVIKYFYEFVAGHGAAVAAHSDDFFGSFIGIADTSILSHPMFWFVVFTVLTSIVVLLGVDKGIEKVSKVMMPVLVILCIIVAGFSLATPGALAGLKYYLLPDFSQFSIDTVLGAMGQLFYSMSIAMGILITYGSYMKKTDSIEKSVRQIEFFDTAVAFLAGLMIIPAVVAFNGGDPSKINAGPGLMFITLPKVFEEMPLGGFVGAIFFLLVFFAAITSSISLMETVVSTIRDKIHMGRKTATVLVTLFVIALGAVSVYGYGPLADFKIIGLQMLDFFDFISNSVLMPIVAFITCILVGYVVGTKTIADEVGLNEKFVGKRLHHVMIRYIAPVFLVAILVYQVFSTFPQLTEFFK